MKFSESDAMHTDEEILSLLPTLQPTQNDEKESAMIDDKNAVRIFPRGLQRIHGTNSNYHFRRQGIPVRRLLVACAAAAN